ncbi:MAG: calcium/proton exchanger [Candidatus Aenigmarchaeota archaeon]|nr:calcium/proton exchanger [Candidatus Aenigmarchaeota archaeon]
MAFPRFDRSDVLFLLLPLSLYLAWSGADRLLVFIAATLSLAPIARNVGKATESIVVQANPAVAGIASATFGNIVEIVIAITAINQGLFELVKATIIGSIIANILLLIGLAVFFGGLRFKEQTFNRQTAGVSSTMLIIAVAGISIPSAFAIATGKNAAFLEVAVAGIMAAVYVAGLVFAFKTHKHLFDVADTYRQERIRPVWDMRKSLLVLGVCITLAAVASDLLVRTIEPAALQAGISQAFIGITIIAVLSNLTEMSAAISMALRNKLDISLEIGTSSATQIALFVLPILVFTSHLIGKPFSPVFSLFQIIAMFFAVMIVNYLSADGRCNWLEGAQLITVYLILAAAFYFV